MCEFISTYQNYAGLKFDADLTGHGAVYGCGGSGKTYVVNKLMLNGQMKKFKTIVLLASKSNPPTPQFLKTMKERWGTSVYFYRISSQEELEGKIRSLEDSFLKHRIDQYARVKKMPPDHVDLRPGYAFGNLKLIIDDLHKEVVNSKYIAGAFQFIRHSGIEFLWLTQSFKNTNHHDLIKENLQFVIIFKLTQNKVTLKSYLADLSLHTSGGRVTNKIKSSLEKIYNNLVMQNDKILTFNTSDTNYLYIAMPKRHIKGVFDVRTCITNPNRQVCFQECNVAENSKILFAEREIPLTYGNRAKDIKMVVLNEEQQIKSLKIHKDNENENDDKDSMVKLKVSRESSSEEDEVGSGGDNDDPIFNQYK